jgi:hypothetical protein
MDDKNNTVEIRLSRIPLFVLFIAGCFFFMMGMDIVFLHNIIPEFHVEQSKKLFFYLFAFFFIGGGGAIAVQMLLYLMAPPIMFRASDDGVSFGTGFRYKLYTIPWKHVKNIGPGLDKAVLIFNRKIMFGLSITFENSPDIPSAKPTSIGISYAFYTLTLSYIYTGMIPSEMMGSIEQMKKRHSG